MDLYECPLAYAGRQLVDLVKVVGLTEQRGLPYQDRNLEMEPT